MKSKRVPELDDACMPLKEWRTIVEQLILKYGEDAIMQTDGGTNNVELIVTYKKEKI